MSPSKRQVIPVERRNMTGDGFSQNGSTAAQRAGMTSLRSSTTVSVVMLLAALMEAMGTLYFAAMPESVSPLETTWTVPPAVAGGVAGRAGLAG